MYASDLACLEEVGERLYTDFAVILHFIGSTPVVMPKLFLFALFIHLENQDLFCTDSDCL